MLLHDSEEFDGEYSSVISRFDCHHVLYNLRPLFCSLLYSVARGGSRNLLLEVGAL